MDGLRDMMGHQNVRRGIPILIAVVVLLIMATMYSSMTPDSFRAVYPGMEESDRQLALEELDENGFNASIDSKSGNLMVPSDKYHQARIFLSSKGIPQKPVIGGFQSLNEQSSMTTSQFMEQARYVNAVENELARSVGEISTIQSARVHLALPKQSVFREIGNPLSVGGSYSVSWKGGGFLAGAGNCASCIYECSQLIANRCCGC